MYLVSKRNMKRYRLHSVIRKQGYKLITNQKTIFIPHNAGELSRHVKILKNEFDYGIQTTII